jgi:putative redox protein
MNSPAEKITFPGTRGQALAARLDLPAGSVRAYALFAHCFTCSKDVLAAGRIAAGLAERGVAVLRFDFTGLGSSEGDFANTSFTSNIEDLLAAAGYMRDRHRAPDILIGHSLGGAAVLRAALDIPEARLVATIGAPADPVHVRRLIKDPDDEIHHKGKAMVDIGGRPFEIGAGFLDDLVNHRPRDYLGKLRKALMVFHAPLDQTVGIENAGEIFVAARHPKSFIALDGADHLLTNLADAVYVADMIGGWVSRYVDDPGRTLEPEVSEGVVQVLETGRGRLEREIRVGSHALIADEPVSAGGTDRGPSPYGLLSAALGACTSMTLRLYADSKKWPLERVRVEVRHDKVYAEDNTRSEDAGAKIDRFQREIRMEGDLTPEQRDRLMQIADKCPVHRTLTSDVRIETHEDG